jgi:quercetin dioxygenase-like cupin family protein
VLQRTDIPGIEGKEGVIILAEIFPGAVTPKHYHPGNELSYVLEGSMVLEVEGRPPVTYSAGESYILPAKQVHYAKNVSMTAPVKVLSFAIVDKGQPLSFPVK